MILSILPIFVLMLLDWVGVAFKRKPLEYIGKLGVMIYLIAWVILQAGELQTPEIWLIAALVLSLMGDVLMVLPKRQFLLGVSAFFLAHLAYIGAFNPLLFDSRTILESLVFGIPIALIAWSLSQHLTAALKLHGREKYILPIRLYFAGLAGMVFMAGYTFISPKWFPPHAWLAAFGGLFFAFSDIWLAWNRFVRPLPGGRLVTHIFYHLGQVLLAFGILLYTARIYS